VIVRHDFFEIERIEQLPLILAALAHHHPSPADVRISATESLFASRFNQFCNKIGPRAEELKVKCGRDGHY
jgi:hypothetical protein